MKDMFGPQPLGVQVDRRSFLGGVGALGVAGLALGVSGCSSNSGSGSSSKSINVVNTQAPSGLTILRLLESRGYYDDFGVKVNTKNVAGGTQVTAALQSGEADLTVLSGATSLFTAIDSGLPFRFLGGTELISTTALYTNDSSVKSIRDVSGKSVASGPVGALIYECDVAMFTKYGVDPKKVHFINIGSQSATFQAVLGKKVQVGSGEVSFAALAQRSGLRTIGVVADELPLWINQAACATTTAIKNKREGLVGVLAAYAKLFNWLITDPAAEEEYVKTYVALKGTEESARALYKFIVKYKAYTPTLELPGDRLAYMQKQNIAAGAQKKTIPTKDLVDLSIGQAAAKLAKAGKSN